MSNEAPTSGPRLYSVQQFCEKCGLSRSFFYKLLKQGEGPKLVKIGRRTLIDENDATTWLQDFKV